ncbi:acyl-[ACP]--phospholipid O-acyltransferase [Hyphomicrobium methylovorum]|uniref:acyl-[ACP]--phospholipid O-acyltransferase n=1 Tax=Hyphomicrobium methylovorum TaxID=84 RepID=UPI0015E6C52F|nr:acyl-[ACP]--phospholipid O-acyltransferase [Hyphomicrobium methylovorum]MBA2126785.1 acyl-[ACP]--phospholipid O-acyltransferase [Hyphomicrobium methylovorum]
MFSELMTSRRFAPLFWSQLLAALNDNLLKNALAMLVIYRLAMENGPAIGTLAGAALILPFFLFSSLAGQYADKYDKAAVATRVRLLEIPIALAAAIGFLIPSVTLLFIALILFGTLSAFFGPVKYGLLPTHLELKELPAGNAAIEGATFLAILMGTIGGNLASGGDREVLFVAGAIVIISVLGWLSARAIPPAPSPVPDLVVDTNIFTSTKTLIADLRTDRRIWQGALITSWFWLVGAAVLALLQNLIPQALNGAPSVYTLALFTFAVAVALGSIAAARASRNRPNLALVPIGALLMGLFLLDLALLASRLTPAATPLGMSDTLQSVTGIHMLIDLAGIAFAGGLYIVPAFAAVQAWSPIDRRSRVIAGCNVLSAAFMALAGLAIALLQYEKISVALLYAGLGLANLIVVALVLRAWGAEGVKDVGVFLFRTFFGVEVIGRENLPQPGEKAIIAPNHVSLLDAPLMHALMPSHATFAIDTGMANTWWVKPFLKLAKAYPIDPTRPLGMRHLIQAVKDGSSLIIFPEGRLTVTGGLMKVYDGTAMIADKADAPIIPVRIEGLERSRFGYLSSSQTKKSWFPKTTVTILPPVRLKVDPALRGKQRRLAAGAALQDVMTDSAVMTTNIDQTLFEALAEARNTRDTGKPAVQDPLGTKLSYKKLIVGAQVLGKKLEPMLPPAGETVGVLLPNSAGVAVTFFALQTMGRVPAMLNFSAGAANVLAACKAAKVSVVLTSRVFVEKGHFESLVQAIEGAARVIYLEDVRATVSFTDKLRGLAQGSTPQVKRDCNSPAAILFTSGSEGLPKGVVLSHRNLLANCAQSLTRVACNGSDKVFNALPVFHSFGLTAGLLMPLVAGVPVYLYPTPLHYRIIPELVYGSNATILFGTDTFLSGYARVAHPYDFARVRLVLAGAEAIKDRTRQLYMDRFGVRILEGYGVTETAPVLAINTPLANKAGTVGRLSPLMEARLDPVPGIETGGRLYVRGPNVMLGYYRAENPGVLEPPQDGWHDTGDIVEIDPQGFIAIKGRAKRFAKIAGEMVSLSAVEALAAELWPNLITVVVSLPDARKGERLALLTTDASPTREAFSQFARRKGATELMVPADILHVSKIPLLGSGKPDYVAALELAKAAMAEKSGSSADSAKERPVAPAV